MSLLQIERIRTLVGSQAAGPARVIERNGGRLRPCTVEYRIAPLVRLGQF